MQWDAFVGLPWTDKGRGPDGYDCWGLFRAVQLAGQGLDLPSYAAHYTSAREQDEVRRIAAGERGDWLPVEAGSEQAFDGATMRLGGELHIGVIVRRGRLLHVRRGMLSCIEPLSRFAANELELFRHRLVGQT